MDIKVAQTSEGVVEYGSMGAGFPIIFLHGGHSNALDTLPYKGLDTSKYRLITPSRPGYGQTPLNGHQSPEKAADLVAALMDELNIKTAVIYGISAGGLTAIQLAIRYPDKVERLILASAVTKNWLDPKGKTYKMACRMFKPGVEKFIWNTVSFFAGLLPRTIAKSFFSQFSSCKKPEITKGEVRELIQTLQYYRSKQGFINDIDQTIDEAELANIRCPVLILHSQYDVSVPIEHANNAYHQIPDAKLHVLDNKWGHLLWIGEDYDDVLQKINRFIDH